MEIPAEVLNAKELLRNWNATKPKKKYDAKIYNKKFYTTHQDRIKESKLCGCGGNYTYYNSGAHKRTNKHIKWAGLNEGINGSIDTK